MLGRDQRLRIVGPIAARRSPPAACIGRGKSQADRRIRRLPARTPPASNVGAPQGALARQVGVAGGSSGRPKCRKAGTRPASRAYILNDVFGLGRPKTRKAEREKRFELSTSTLARLHQVVSRSYEPFPISRNPEKTVQLRFLALLRVSRGGGHCVRSGPASGAHTAGKVVAERYLSLPAVSRLAVGTN